MNIVYLVESIDIAGGIERSLTTRVNYLMEHYDYKITIVCTEKKTGIPYYDLNNKVELIFLESLTSKKTVLGRIKLRYDQTKRIVNDINPNVIITVKYTLHNLFFQLIKKNFILVSEIREPKEQYDSKINSTKSKLNALIRNNVFSRQDLVIVLTEADKKSWGFKKAVVIPNPKTIESSQVSDLNNTQVLALGRLDKVKGFDKLIESWKIVVNTFPNWKLKICGAGPEFDNLNQQIVDLNLSSQIELTNEFMPVIPEFLQSSIFVVTSQYEAFGNVLVEAKVCGLPSVAFDAPNGPREIIIDNVDGYLVALNDVEGLAQKFFLLISNESLRKEMGRMAKINSEIYNLDKIMLKYHRVLINTIT
jgi:glycosyltransferase involved in cell wall biosynthesis